MAGRFSAFSFVDRITSLEPGARIAGRYTIPPHATRFPASLMAEAIGQLAAWAAMSQAGFQRRPVAGLAAETLYLGATVPGETLNLEVDIQACDEDAIAYGGRAHVNGACVLELRHCVGPMLPMEEFDSPAAVRADFEMLRGPGAPPGRFGGLDAPETRILEHAAGERLRAELLVPSAAPFFADHFPLRPVFPGTLLMDSQAELALALAREAAPLRDAMSLAIARIANVKIRSFTDPGQRLELSVQLISATEQGATLSVAARAEGKGVATARVEVAPRRSP